MNEELVSKIKERLIEREEKHVCCPSEVHPNLLKRVVDIGAASSNPRPSLHISDSDQKAPYIALSYCWGGPQNITTTLATLGTYTSSLPTQLPRSLQDAIRITRSLGFRYLWIDALCIVQDDDSDKSAEIRNMGRVYKNATLTIAAASARSVENGFLEDRPQLPICQLPFYITEKRLGSIWIRNPAWSNTREPLDSRAWSLPESLLSPRILYYATKDLLWECQGNRCVPVNETHNPCLTGVRRRLTNEIFSPSQISCRAASFALIHGPDLGTHSCRTSHV